MDINERIKEIRKIFGKSQLEFGASIGLKQSTIGNYEKGTRSISDATILAICKTYNVNEEWLRYGIGKPVKDSATIIDISMLAEEFDLDEIDQNLITQYLRLSKQNRTILKDYIKQVMLVSDSETEYIKSRSNFAQKTTSYASNITEDIEKGKNAANQ